MFDSIKYYIKQNLAQLDTNGIMLDETINTLTGGEAGMTVSMRAAQGAGWRADGRTGERKPGWCLFCRFLSAFVQRDHCADQFSTAPSSWTTWVRAGLCFSVGIIGVIHIVRAFPVIFFAAAVIAMIISIARDIIKRREI